MQNISIEQGGRSVANIATISNRLRSLIPANMPAAARLKAPMLAPVAPVAPVIEDSPDEERAVRETFVHALIASHNTEVSLVDAVQAGIDAGYDRDDMIEWGTAARPYGAGLSDGYVRSTVSRLFIALVGRVKKVGGGNKRQAIAVRVAKLALKYFKNDFAKAKKVLLAARRVLESMEKAATKE